MRHPRLPPQVLHVAVLMKRQPGSTARPLDSEIERGGKQWAWTQSLLALPQLLNRGVKLQKPVAQFASCFISPSMVDSKC